MERIKSEKKMCPSCMEVHDVYTVKVPESNQFKGVKVNYCAVYEYCERSDEFWATEDMIASNDIAMKNSYRVRQGLLTTNDIAAIRAKYQISQTDLAILLNWGEKTITRYEGHQVQDAAHNTVLAKIDSDPEWFIELLEAAKGKISLNNYTWCLLAAKSLLDSEAKGRYLKKAINAQYVPYIGDVQSTGAVELNLDKVVDIVNYFANAVKVRGLYLVKLLKLMWYSDALSYKRHGKAMTGLVYEALPMGAVPVAYNLLLDLPGVEYEAEEFSEGIGYRFVRTSHTSYPTLTPEDIDVLQTVICRFGQAARSTIVDCMHKEWAYKITPLRATIQYEHALELSIN